MQNKLNRRKSRAVAMELLYSGTVNARSGEITEEFLDDFISMSDTTDNLDRKYIRKILNIVEGKEEYLKGVIRPFLKDWDINRLSRVNLAILKIAAGELLFMDDIPDRVSLNEAIELSKIYSDEESTSFINGVLDKILKAKAQGTIAEETIAEETTESVAAPQTPESEEASEHQVARTEDSEISLIGSDDEDPLATVFDDEVEPMTSDAIPAVSETMPQDSPAEIAPKVGSDSEPAEAAAEGNQSEAAETEAETEAESEAESDTDTDTDTGTKTEVTVKTADETIEDATETEAQNFNY